MPQLRALIFDFDGLILDTETPLIEAYGDVYREDGHAFDKAAFAAAVGHIDYHFNAWAVYGPDADEKVLEDRRRVFNRKRLEHQLPLPGVVDLLQEAKAAGLRLGVASNSQHEWVEGNLERLGLHSLFSAFACRGDVPSPKPEPDIFKHAANLLGVRPCEAAGFEDSEAGVKAASRAGLFVVAVPNVSTATHDHSVAHLKLRSMADINLAKLRELHAAWNGSAN